MTEDLLLPVLSEASCHQLPCSEARIWDPGSKTASAGVLWGGAEAWAGGSCSPAASGLLFFVVLREQGHFFLYQEDFILLRALLHALK